MTRALIFVWFIIILKLDSFCKDYDLEYSRKFINSKRARSRVFLIVYIFSIHNSFKPLLPNVLNQFHLTFGLNF